MSLLSPFPVGVCVLVLRWWLKALCHFPLRVVNERTPGNAWVKWVVTPWGLFFILTLMSVLKCFYLPSRLPSTRGSGKERLTGHRRTCVEIVLWSESNLGCQDLSSPVQMNRQVAASGSTHKHHSKLSDGSSIQKKPQGSANWSEFTVWEPK